MMLDSKLFFPKPNSRNLDMVKALCVFQFAPFEPTIPEKKKNVINTILVLKFLMYVN